MPRKLTTSEEHNQMTITQPALDRLLSSREAPVGQTVKRRAPEVTAAARRNAAVVMHRLPEVVSAIDYQGDASTPRKRRKPA
jgi:hypothetical protein